MDITNHELILSFERSAKAHRKCSEIYAEIAEIIEPWESAILAVLKSGARAKRVRMPRDTLARLQAAHDRLCEVRRLPPYDVVSLYDLPIGVSPR